MNFFKCANRVVSLSGTLSNRQLFSTKRNIIHYYQRFLATGPKVSSRVNINAKDTTQGNLIYEGPLTSQIRMVKFLSLSSTLFGFSVQPYLIAHAGGTHVAVIIAVASFVGFFTYVTPFLIHFITKRYVMQMHYQPPTTNTEKGIFTSTTIGFFLNRKCLTFTADDVEIPDVPGVFTTALAKKVPLLFTDEHFTDLEAYKHLMGYDKPIDLQLKSKIVQETEDKNKSGKS